MNTPYPPSPGTPGSSASDNASRDSGSGSARAREDVRQTVDHARKGAAERVEGVAGSIDAAAAHLDDVDMGRLSGYVHDMAASLGGLADDLRSKSGDEMLHQLNRFARQNPALFIGGSVAVGFGLTRFARASRSRDRQLPLPIDQARVEPTTVGSSPSTFDTGAMR